MKPRRRVEGRKPPQIIIRSKRRDNAPDVILLSQDASPPEAKGHEPVRIVIVDDNPFMRELIAMMLRQHSSRYEVLAEVANAKSAVESMRAVGARPSASGYKPA